jgi:hypothetical protein
MPQFRWPDKLSAIKKIRIPFLQPTHYFPRKLVTRALTTSLIESSSIPQSTGPVFLWSPKLIATTVTTTAMQSDTPALTRPVEHFLSNGECAYTATLAR